MLKMIFNIGLVMILSFDLYGAACGSFDKQTVGSSYDYCSTTIVADANKDVRKLKTIYECILEKSKAVAGGTNTNYSEVIGEAVILENECVAYNIILNKKIKSLNNTTTSASCKADAVGGTLPSGRATLLSDGPVADVTSIADNAKAIATGVYASQAAKDKTDYKDEVTEWEKDHDPAKGSLLKSLVDVKTDETKLAKALKGKYTDTDDADEFISDLKNDKYELPPDVGEDPARPFTNTGPTAPTGPTADTGLTSATGTTGLTAAEQAALYQKMLDKMEDLERDANNNNNSNVVAASPVVTTTPTKSDSGGSGSGLGSLSGFGSRNMGMDDDERKERIARAKEREKDMMRQNIDKKVFGSSTKPLSAPKTSAGSGSSRFSDLFSSKKPALGTTDTKTAKKPSFFDKDSTDEKAVQGDEKYKAYFKSGNLPPSFSSKELALNRFSSMYDAAKMKALTEDAYQEFAGRYIDLFLLVHTILDHEYREKGKLMDLSEIVPSPLGPATPKKKI